MLCRAPARFLGLLTIASVCACAAADEQDGDPFADEVVSFNPAGESSFGHDRLPEVVLGPPAGINDVASLGCDGELVLRFDEPGIVDGPGVDLIVFENPFDASFPEPGEVAVSEDGERWFAWTCVPELLEGCAGITPTLAYPDSGIDPTDPAVAGGDGFDLALLEDRPAQVFFVRVRDRSRAYWEAQGSGQYCEGQQGAGGFDLDAVAAVH
jgi:hypothetical protein